MPIIGEIKYGREIGRKNSMRFMWCACVGCGKERWVMLVKDKPENDKCVRCCKIGKKIVYHGNMEILGAKEGDIKTPKELNFTGHNKSKYIYAKCPNCGNLRWVQLKTVDKYKKCKQCMNRGKIKEKSGTWKGGRKINYAGYIMVRLYPDNPYYEMANTAGYVFEHRLVMAQQLGRCLKDWELVHHKGINYPINSILNKSDNVPENLKYIGLKGEHNTLVEQIMSQKDARIKELEAELAKRT
jgi:ribosomal protein S27E